MIKSKKFVSFMLAFVMIFSVFAGSLSKADDNLREVKTAGTVKASLLKIHIDGKDIGEAITTGVIEKYGLKLKEKDSNEYYDFNSDDKKLVSSKEYNVVAGSKYEIEKIDVDVHLPLTEENNFGFVAVGVNHNFDIWLKTKPTIDFKATVTVPEDVTSEMSAKIYEKGKTTPFVDDFKIGTAFKLTKGLTYELKFDNIPKGYELFEKDGENALTTYEFEIKSQQTEPIEAQFEFKEKISNSEVIRLYGNSRIDTALKLARESYTKSDNVVIANGYKPADALVAGPLANALEAPILLVEDDYATDAVIEYIKSLEVKNIYIAGGKSSVKNELADKIAKDVEVKDENVKRLFGNNRDQTSLKIAEELITNHNYNKTVIFSNGSDDKSADALSASTYATLKKQPIVLTGTSSVDKAVKDGLAALGVTNVDIAGGTSTVNNSVLTDANVKLNNRFQGANRFATSLKIAEAVKELDKTKVKTVILANGNPKPSVDALAAAPLAYKENAVVLLNDGIKLPENQTKFIEDLHKATPIEKAYIAGGKTSVSNELMDSLNTLIQETAVSEAGK